MKKQVSHIVFFLFTASLVTAAGLLAFNGLSQDVREEAEVSKNQLSLDEKPSDSALDTTRFFEKPCYEYCQLESTGEGDEQVDVLSKTVVKVENDKGDFESIEESSIKEFPANKSLNLMVEKYTLKRKMIDSNPSFFVTVESFNTRITQSDIFGITFDSEKSFQTLLNDDQLDMMKAYCDDSEAFNYQTSSRPL